MLLPPLGKLSHGSKVLHVFTLPLGSRVNIYGRQELRGFHEDNSRPSLPFPSAARRGAGDGEPPRKQKTLRLFFLVEPEKPADGDSPVVKNKINNWYTISPISMQGQTDLWSDDRCNLLNQATGVKKLQEAINQCKHLKKLATCSVCLVVGRAVCCTLGRRIKWRPLTTFMLGWKLF